MKGTEFIGLGIVALVVWELARSSSTTTVKHEISLGDPTVVASDPGAQLGNDYATARPDPADALATDPEVP